MKPLIALTSEYIPEPAPQSAWHGQFLLENYTQAVIEAGGLPVILPLADKDTAQDTLKRMDGLILTGSIPDLPPEVFGEKPHPTVIPMPMERWKSEQAWYLAAKTLDLPILAICSGMQVIGVTEGNSLIQDIPDQCEGAHPHADSSRLLVHDVQIEPGSRLAKFAPALRVPVTSAHHQALRTAKGPLKVVAKSDDGIIEAIEHADASFILGAQWHPERNGTKPDWLIEGFVGHCANQ